MNSILLSVDNFSNIVEKKNTNLFLQQTYSSLMQKNSFLLLCGDHIMTSLFRIT